VVLVRRGKVWLVANVHDGVDAGAVGSQVRLGGVDLEDVVKSRFEGFCSAHEADQSLHVVRDGEGVFFQMLLVYVTKLVDLECITQLTEGSSFVCN
jgi:hypothetical protein